MHKCLKKNTRLNSGHNGKGIKSIMVNKQTEYFWMILNRTEELVCIIARGKQAELVCIMNQINKNKQDGCALSEGKNTLIV